MYICSHSCYIFIFMPFYIHIHVCYIFHIHIYMFTLMLYFYIHAFFICYNFHIHVFLFTFMIFFIFKVMLSMVLFIHIHGLFSRQERIWMHHFTFIVNAPKSILCYNNSRQCILVWSSCLCQPRVYLKFPDHVIPSISSANSQNFALSNQQVSWRSGMSFVLHQEGHRFGPHSAQIFKFCNFFCC